MMLMHDINPNLPQIDIEALFEYFDENSSGRIDLNEFLR